MRREERVTVQGPVKEQQPDGMSHSGGMLWSGTWDMRAHGRLACLRKGHHKDPWPMTVTPVLLCLCGLALSDLG